MKKIILMMLFISIFPALSFCNEYKLTCKVVNFGLQRCENKEIVCYIPRISNMFCKWK